VDAAYAKYKTLQEGKNADYIPALAKVDPNLFGSPWSRRTARCTPPAM
jgi:glutaminase